MLGGQWNGKPLEQNRYKWAQPECSVCGGVGSYLKDEFDGYDRTYTYELMCTVCYCTYLEKSNSGFCVDCENNRRVFVKHFKRNDIFVQLDHKQHAITEWSREQLLALYYKIQNVMLV